MSDNRYILARALLDAAELLASEGWTQGRYEDERGRRCVMGAIRCTAGRTEHLPVKWALLAYLREQEPGLVTVEEWNDAPHRTEAEVCAALLHARLLLLKEAKR